MRIRDAGLGDLEALLALETESFESDRLDRPRLRHLLTRGHAVTRVAEEEGRLLGYVLILFRRGSRRARIYSIAVARAARGRGVGRRLLADAEAEAADRGCNAVRSEVRRDNRPSRELFRSAGYREFGEYADYYEDHEDAIRYERSLEPSV